MFINQTKQHQGYIVAFFASLLICLVLVHEPLYAAIKIWIGNEIYNHCLIVIPASIFLIYERRHQLDWSRLSTSWLGLVFFLGELLFYILGTAADIQLFQHIAIFSMLPTLVWIYLGDHLAWQLKFPLCFVLFAVPVGEELIPFLQEITADISVYLLELTGIPLFRSGLFIEIPQGKFLVAEACSGVSFLIASIVLGNLYAYMNLRSWKTRCAFVLLSVLFPIAANALRVYGIIYIGYSTDMEHAVGADHLIYGWFFFAFVLICLFLLGELIRRYETKRLNKLQANSQVSKQEDKQKNIVLSKEFSINLKVSASILILILLAFVQVSRMNPDIAKSTVDLSLSSLGLQSFSKEQGSYRLRWAPRYVGNSAQAMHHLSFNTINPDVFVAYFDGSDGELVSSLNRLYEQDRWTLVKRQTIKVNDYNLQYERVSSSIGISKHIVYWYVVNGKLVHSFKDVKLLQLVQTLKGLPTQSYIVAAAIDFEQKQEKVHPELERFAKELLNKLTILESKQQ